MPSWFKKSSKPHHRVKDYDERVARRIHDAIGEDELVERHTSDVVRGEVPIILENQPYLSQHKDASEIKGTNGDSRMEKLSITDVLKAKAEKLDYDLDAHRWVLYIMIFFIFYTIIFAYQIADLRDGILASAEGQQSIYKHIDTLQQQINALQQSMTKLQYLPAPAKQSLQNNTSSPSSLSPQIPANSEKTPSRRRPNI